MPPLGKSAPRWGRIVARTCAVLGLAGVVGYFGASYALNRYLHGDAFRALLNQKTSAFLNAEGQYFPIQCNGFSFYSDGYSARGRDGSPLQELLADQVRAEFQPAGVFEGVWRVDSVQVQRVKAVLNAASSSGSSDGIPVSRSARAASAPSWIPDQFELRQARVEEAELVWNPPGNAGRLYRMRLILEPNGRDLTATGYGGVLEQTGWPVLTIGHLKVRCRYPELFLTDGLLQLSDSETLNVSGQANFGPEPVADLLVKFSGIGISPYLPVDWRAGVKGNANGEARITGKPGALQVTGSLSLAGGQLEALPVLETIAAFTRTRQFRQFALQKAEAEFVWTSALLTVSNLNAESEGLIRLTGGFRVEKGELLGTFELGVAPSTLRWLPGSRAHVFTQQRDGYAWTTLKVSGSLDHLNEDLTARLTAAAGEELIQGVRGTIENGAKNLFDLLKSAAP